jgi:hypothetical protein
MTPVIVYKSVFSTIKDTTAIMSLSTCCLLVYHSIYFNTLSALLLYTESEESYVMIRHGGPGQQRRVVA